MKIKHTHALVSPDMVEEEVQGGDTWEVLLALPDGGTLRKRILRDGNYQPSPGEGEACIITYKEKRIAGKDDTCLLYTSPSPRDATLSRMPYSA